MFSLQVKDARTEHKFFPFGHHQASPQVAFNSMGIGGQLRTDEVACAHCRAH